MKLNELISLFESSQRPYHLYGTENSGCIVALDIEGRIFTYLNGRVLSTVRAEAFTSISDINTYYNPGGDVLWPAPEGSRLGYEYSTNTWRVPPGLTNARWQVIKNDGDKVIVSAEVDLINAESKGIPCIFTREISQEYCENELIQNVRESIEYIGKETYTSNQVLLAPWSLCQFDCHAESELRLPACNEAEIWDLYSPESKKHWQKTDNGWRIAMKTDFRFQLGLSEKVEYLEFVDKRNNYSVLRRAEPIADNLSYIDISDQDPRNEPDGKAVVLSAYCDPSGFMEVEAAGGSAKILEPNTESCLNICTIFKEN